MRGYASATPDPVFISEGRSSVMASLANITRRGAHQDSVRRRLKLGGAMVHSCSRVQLHPTSWRGRKLCVCKSRSVAADSAT